MNPPTTPDPMAPFEELLDNYLEARKERRWSASHEARLALRDFITPYLRDGQRLDWLDTNWPKMDLFAGVTREAIDAAMNGGEQ